MVKRAIELGEFNVNYRLRTAIKGQVLANFLAELMSSEVDDRNTSKLEWTLYVDRSSTASASGARLLLTTLEGVEIEFAIRLEFNSTNNEAKYEALISGLSMVKEVRARRITVYTDSKMVERQVTGEYEAKEDRMKKYLAQVKGLVFQIKNAKIQHIPRNQNEHTD